MKDEDIKITPEEKEMISRLMETLGIEKDWDFFQDLNMDVPLPEYFMRAKPKPPSIVTRLRWLFTGQDRRTGR